MEILEVIIGLALSTWVTHAIINSIYGVEFLEAFSGQSETHRWFNPCLQDHIDLVCGNFTVVYTLQYTLHKHCHKIKN